MKAIATCIIFVLLVECQDHSLESNVRKGIREVSYNPKTEYYILTSLNGKECLKSESFAYTDGIFAGYRFTKYRRGKEKITVYDKKTHKLKKIYD